MAPASDRALAPRGPARSRGTRLAVSLTALLVASCASPPVPIASPTALPTGSPSPSASASLAPAYADTLRIANLNGRATPMSNYAFGNTLTPASLVLSALYRLTSTLDVVPDLTDGPCLPQGDGTVIRCHLIDTTFSDGTPLTADDVAYSYQLRQAATCAPSFAPCLGVGAITPTYRDVRVVDPRTVEFTLSRPDPTFFTTILPGIAIEPRHVIETAYAQFLVDAAGLTAATLTALADTIDQETNRDPPVCTTRVAQLKGLFARLHIHWYADDFGGDQQFDTCGFSGYGSFVARQVGTALGASGRDAVAAIYPFLSFNWQPVGTGPYRFVSQTTDVTVLEASPTYHDGQPATRFIRLIATGTDGSEIVAGQVDILPPRDGPDPVAGHPEAGLLLTKTPEPEFIALQYNDRPGHLFADRNLRLAMQLCVDLKRVIDTATGDASLAVESPFMPGGWAYDADLPIPSRDVAQARQLIEASGWRPGPDGVYAKAGRRLAAQIVVRGDAPARTKIADLISAETQDCGMDITSAPVQFGADIGQMVSTYPHFIPGTKQPFDLYLGGWFNWPDPGASTSLFDPRLITDKAHPDGNIGNLTGFDDPTVERLIDAGLASYDQADRTQTYRAMQEEIAAQQPMLFLWSPQQLGAIRSAVSTTGAPLDLLSPNPYWQPEDLVVRPAAP